MPDLLGGTPTTGPPFNGETSDTGTTDPQAVLALARAIMARQGGGTGGYGGLGNVVQAQNMTGTETPMTNAAKMALQGQGDKQAIMSTMLNPADKGTYKDFDRDPNRFIAGKGGLNDQYTDYQHKLKEARDAWKAKHGIGRAESMGQFLQAAAPAHGNPGNYMDSTQASMAGPDYPGRSDADRYLNEEQYMPFYLQEGYGAGRPTFELNNEIDWHNAHPDKMDIPMNRGSDPYGVST